MPTLTKRYYTIGQIKQSFKSKKDYEKISLLEEALDIKEASPGLTKDICIAKALGFEPSISGSEFFEKLTSVS